MSTASIGSGSRTPADSMHPGSKPSELLVGPHVQQKEECGRGTSAMPVLVYSNKLLLEIVCKLADSKTLIVTDNYNYPRFGEIGQIVSVEDQAIEHIESVKRAYSYHTVIAAGGCTALDFGRACASGKKMISIPTILSNSCISTNRSVINRGGFYKSETTVAPVNTIVSFPTILENPEDEVNKWSASGLGDLLSGISASIERLWENNDRSFCGLRTEDVARCAPLCTDALNWVLGKRDGFDQAAIKKLAWYLHESSLEVIRKGHSKLSAASEHWLYYRMIERQRYPKVRATHGRLVSIGTLLTTRLFGEETGDFRFYDELRSAFRLAGLPVSYAELADIAVHKDHILQGIDDLGKIDCLYSGYFERGIADVLDRIFAK